MGIFRNIGRMFRREDDEQSYGTISVLNYGTAQTSTVLVNTSAAAECVSAANRCIDLICSSVATAPLQYLKKTGDVFVPDTNHPLHTLLTIEPQREYSKFNFWYAAMKQVIMDGNAYIIPRAWLDRKPRYGAVYLGGYLDCELVLCAPNTVSFDALNGIYTVNDIENGISGRFVERDVVHLYRREGSLWREGMRLLDYAKQAISVAATGDSETLNRFGNGGNVRGIVGNDNSVTGMGEYPDDELNRLAQSMDSKFRSGNRIIGLPGQVNFVPLSLSSTDIQFLESRKFEVLEICRLFGVPPTYVYADTSNNYKSVEAASVDFMNQTLDPILEMIESELQRKLILRSHWNQEKIEYDRLGVYRLDLDTKTKYYREMIASGIYSINDCRRKENLPAVEGGDVILVSANLVPIDSPKLWGTTGGDGGNDKAAEPDEATKATKATKVTKSTRSKTKK